ncbi:16S rRNA (guanine(966)-N(2))-methyltransferase RsmD [Rubritalea spongiae]|uniref:16S rRNA (Guanine(966)-N(2))-methyltransferase RsmD n=1 Tax=Rubritalea spongiae TaxID=430797 RepID=A0ABW5E3N0_9BACT
MRIIAGSAKRREIKVPKAVVRPTTDRTREALFSMIHAYVESAKVLDLFAGAGSLGIEALSRGAASCDFVDMNKICTMCVQENLQKLDLRGGVVVTADVLGHVKRLSGQYDIIFADPPYYKKPGDRDFVSELLAEENLAQILAVDGLLIVEVDAKHSPDVPKQWKQLDKRRYGSCVIMFLQRIEM